MKLSEWGVTTMDKAEDDIPKCGNKIACEIVNSYLEEPLVDRLSNFQLMEGVIYRSKLMTQLEIKIDEITYLYKSEIELLNKELESLRTLNYEDLEIMRKSV